jgi:hypothetical protein
MSRRIGPEGRETAAARSRELRIWYGYGQLGRAKKNGLGLFLHDTVRIYAEVSVLALPALLLITAYPTAAWWNAKGTGLLAWMTMTFVGTLVRGGWIRPLRSRSLGWVTLAPTLLALRLLYFNLAMVTAAYGGLAVATVVGWEPASALWAVGISTLAMLAFPATTHRWLGWRR